MAISTLPRGEIRGRVSLQGRSEVAGLVTFLLRDYNSIMPIVDSLFVAANDLDSTQAGIQDSIAADGSFHLREIPGGRYQLTVHVDSYLDGVLPAVGGVSWNRIVRRKSNLCSCRGTRCWLPVGRRRYGLRRCGWKCRAR